MADVCLKEIGLLRTVAAQTKVQTVSVEVLAVNVMVF